MESSYHKSSEAFQHSGPQYASFAPEGSHNPLIPQYAHAIPAVTLIDNNNKAANGQSQVVKQNPPLYITPTVTWCDNCQMNVDTFTKYYMGWSFLIVFIFILICMPICICCPFLDKRVWNVRHTCSKCNHKLGIHKAGKC
ncbi:hypothetical protein SteCoe_10460 [Stentor coeruleus]|uniref:LITAF domain-containing protein n=1 Tax=Stentor coeruleus TaxID=5963 RepID=A0A1R2CFB7_9CILI|nr:hypothetical protein SteCoe_10460 [Stentor coeruleus]